MAACGCTWPGDSHRGCGEWSHSAGQSHGIYSGDYNGLLLRMYLHFV